MSNPIEISGHTLTIAQVNRVVDHPGQQVVLTPDSMAAVASGHACLSRLIQDEVIYGVNTGFGPLASVVLGRDQLVDLQYNLIRSHAVGMGAPIDSRFVLAAMLARLNTLARGHSGVSRELLGTLEAFINHRIIPVVPEHGAVGASGDLVQLAHIALALIGEGEVVCEGRRMPTHLAIDRHGLAPHRLRPKEGLALINGTAMMTGIAAVLCDRVTRLLDAAIRAGALCLEIVKGFEDGISPALQDVRPHAGQRHVASQLRQHLHGSRRLRQRRGVFAGHGGKSELHSLDAPVQEVYSIRCIPQILGPVFDTLTAVSERVQIELNAVTDNPVVLWDEERTVHGGNFHGDYISLSVDELKIVAVKLTMLAERRVNFLLHPNIKHPWEPFLNRKTPGLTLALQGLQFVATSTTAQSQTLGYPQYLHSIPTNGDNQDVVSLGTDAALVADRVVDNAFIVQAIEAAVLAQAVDCAGIGAELCEASRAFYQHVRDVLPVVDEDRFIAPELHCLFERIRSAPLPAFTSNSGPSVAGQEAVRS